jgi:HSP20 family protein
MAPQMWTPPLQLSELRHQFDELLEHHFGRPAARYQYPAQRIAPIEYYKEGDKLVVQIDVPGVDPKDIDVTLRGDGLKISGEREDRRQEKQRDFVLTEVNYGRFERSVRVPQGLENEHVIATHDKGVLKLVIALPQAIKPRKVPVQAATGSGSDAKAAKKVA